MWGGGSEHGVETTVHCTTGGCLYQYQMRMYEEYGSGTCHWNTQMTQCTHSTIPPLCPPYMADCKLTNAYNVMMPVSDSFRLRLMCPGRQHSQAHLPPWWQPQVASPRGNERGALQLHLDRLTRHSLLSKTEHEPC